MIPYRINLSIIIACLPLLSCVQPDALTPSERASAAPICTNEGYGPVCNDAAKRIAAQRQADQVRRLSEAAPSANTPVCVYGPDGLKCNAAGQKVRNHLASKPNETLVPEPPSAIAPPANPRVLAIMVPVTINNRLTLDFVVDSGATDVAIPGDVVLTLIRTGTLKKEDFLGTETYMTANGQKVPSSIFVLRNLSVAGHTLQNVRASTTPVAGPLLLGQSFLSRFQAWSIDNTKHTLILN